MPVLWTPSRCVKVGQAPRSPSVGLSEGRARAAASASEQPRRRAASAQLAARLTVCALSCATPARCQMGREPVACEGATLRAARTLESHGGCRCCRPLAKSERWTSRWLACQAPGPAAYRPQSRHRRMQQNSVQHRVVVGIADGAHRRAHAHLLAPLAEGDTGVLAGRCGGSRRRACAVATPCSAPQAPTRRSSARRWPSPRCVGSIHPARWPGR